LKRTAIEQRYVQTLRSNAQEAQRQLLTEKQTAYAKVRSVSSMTQDLQTLERQLWTSMPAAMCKSVVIALEFRSSDRLSRRATAASDL
jgi:conjugative transfer pilus assembly protein TraH